ncbi:unnamed protein product, partial [Prorocentrum cordatum]
PPRAEAEVETVRATLARLRALTLSGRRGRSRFRGRRRLLPPWRERPLLGCRALWPGAGQRPLAWGSCAVNWAVAPGPMQRERRRRRRRRRRTITRSNNNSSKRMQKRVYVLMEIRPLQTLMNPFREELDLFGGGGGRRRMDEEEEEEDEEQQQQQQQAYAKKGLRPDGDQATVDIDEFIPLL